MKKILSLMLMMGALLQGMAFAEEDPYAWAEEGVKYCVENKIMEGDEHGNLLLSGNLTRAQMAKMVSVACSLKEPSKNEKTAFSDVNDEAWYYTYVLRIEDFLAEKKEEFNPDTLATREDFISSIIYASEIVTNVEEDVISEMFLDADRVSGANFEAVNAAVFHGYIIGDAGMLRPDANLTRAEACVFLERILNDEIEKQPVIDWENEVEKQPVVDWENEVEKQPDSDDEKEIAEPEQDAEKNTLVEENIPVPTDKKYTYGVKTPIKGESVKTMEQAVEWAKRNNAADIFIDVAPLYWQYGEIFGIRADVMYAQAAKETGFGRYTGRVKPEMNNWAGIKKYGAVGDETDDHESFETPDDGVRGHFNHMSAYVGVEPVGETHGRYKSVKSLAWAGTVEYVEQLGGKWCPDPNYGYSILADYVDKM